MAGRGIYNPWSILSFIENKIGSSDAEDFDEERDIWYTLAITNFEVKKIEPGRIRKYGFAFRGKECRIG